MKKIDHAASAYRKASVGSPADKKTGFIKTSVADASVSRALATAPSQKNETKDSGYLKAAKFLLVIGPEQAAEVLKQFSDDDVEKIVREISRVKKLKKKESADILNEVGKLSQGQVVDSRGGPETEAVGGAEKARQMLTAAFGKEEGGRIFDKVLPFGGRRPFDFLDDLQPEQILLVIKNEPPYVMSIVLSFLKPELSSKIISRLPPESRKEIVLRIARQGEIAPGVIEKMEGIFRDRIRTQGKISTEEIDGKSVLADILKYMEPGSEDKILGDITRDDTDLAEEIREKIYTIDLIMLMDDKGVQNLLRDFGNSELAVIIKGKEKGLRKKILDNVSERRRNMIEEESVYLGEMLRSDVDKATKELVDYMIDLEQRGLVIIPRGNDRYI